MAGWVLSPRLAVRSRSNPATYPRARVQPLEDPLLFIARKGHAGDLLRRLNHVDRDRLGVLRDGRERTGHQRRSEAARREAFDESAPVDGASLLIHFHEV